MRRCGRRFVTTFPSLLGCGTSVVISSQQGVCGFVSARAQRARRRSRPSPRASRDQWASSDRDIILVEESQARRLGCNYDIADNDRAGRSYYPVFYYAGFALLVAAITFSGIALVALVNALSVIESRSAVLCVLPG